MLLSASSHWSFTGILWNRWGRGTDLILLRKWWKSELEGNLEISPVLMRANTCWALTLCQALVEAPYLICFLNPCRSLSTAGGKGGTYWTSSTRNWGLREVKQLVRKSQWWDSNPGSDSISCLWNWWSAVKSEVPQISVIDYLPYSCALSPIV